MDSYRTFVALELPRAVRAKVIEHIEQLRRIVPEARASWTREHNLHLTLKFLGNVPVAEIPKLSDAIERAVTGISRFELTVAGCGVFPPKGKPNVLWIGISEPPAVAGGRTDGLRILHERIEDECAAADFPREQRAFHPHLTIARLRKTGGERRLGEAHQSFEFPSETFSIYEVIVFKSELLREGSKHTPISRHDLHQ